VRRMLRLKTLPSGDDLISEILGDGGDYSPAARRRVASPPALPPAACAATTG
jgi:hypothetical protein